MKECEIPGCHKNKKGSSRYCSMHLARWTRTRRFDLRPKKDKLEEETIKQENGCWIYTGYRNNTGYGRLWIGKRCILAHRLMYERYFGPIPDGFEVCHKCDNPACVNPDHLFLGTHLQNMQDMVKKGRESHVSGEKSGNSKLKECEVIEIYKLYKSGLKPSQIAPRYGVSRSAIKKIVAGTSWMYLHLKGDEHEKGSGVIS